MTGATGQGLSTLRTKNAWHSSLTIVVSGTDKVIGIFLLNVPQEEGLMKAKDHGNSHPAAPQVREEKPFLSRVAGPTHQHSSLGL